MLKRGAQFVYSDQTIEWILTMRLLLRLPLRQTQGFIQSLLDCRVAKGPWRWCCRPNAPINRCTWWSIQPA